MDEEMIEANVIFTQVIKPSSPTPNSLQIHRFSRLDQLAPPIYAHLVYFFPSNSTIPHSRKSSLLKNSLPEVLSRFYPLAGRLVGNSHVDCNDAGVPFTDAEADCLLAHILSDRDPKSIYKFAPQILEEGSGGLCMAAQATHFRCGGLALWISLSHKIADGLSFALFVNAWSAAARGGGAALAALPPPKFDAAAYFPPHDVSGFKRTTGSVKEEIAAKVFAFPAAKIAELRERYSAAGFHPTRVEALSAFIWIHYAGPKPDPGKTHTLFHTVNLRPRAWPPLPEYLFGNMYGLSAATAGEGDGGAEVARKVRAAVEAVDGGYVGEARKGEGHLRGMKEMMVKAGRGELVMFQFASLCGYPLYGVDFGWGPPVWVGHGGFPFSNLAVFMDAKSGGGIEALVHLSYPDMEKFQAHFDRLISSFNSSL